MMQILHRSLSLDWETLLFMKCKFIACYCTLICFFVLSILSIYTIYLFSSHGEQMQKQGKLFSSDHGKPYLLVDWLIAAVMFFFRLWHKYSYLFWQQIVNIWPSQPNKYTQSVFLQSICLPNFMCVCALQQQPYYHGVGSTDKPYHIQSHYQTKTKCNHISRSNACL